MKDSVSNVQIAWNGFVERLVYFRKVFQIYNWKKMQKTTLKDVLIYLYEKEKWVSFVPVLVERNELYGWEDIILMSMRNWSKFKL